MDTLTKLAIKYKTDKWGKHHYTPYYYNLFKDWRESVKKVVEIGAGEGASLRMWRDFFPNALIYGGEVDEGRVFKEDRIEVFKCDQADTLDLMDLIVKTGHDIDLFVDDGSHKPEDQVFTLNNIMPNLHKGTIYIIEDVSDPSIMKEIDVYKPEMVEIGKRYDDRLIIVRK